MIIPLKTWTKYKDKLAAIDRRAEVSMISFVQSIGGYGDHVNECLDYAFALATKYGEAAGAAACELYEAVAAASGLTLEAMPAATATYEEVAKSLNGIHKISSDPAKLSQGVSRLVKRTAADTTLQNAVRDGAYFAWVPSGDTCAFCLMLASNGWRMAGKKTLKGTHAEHIHANCDCQYAVTFDPFSGVEGYDPAEYEAMFDGIDGDWNKKVNAVRRQQYAKNKDHINTQKRAAYERKKKLGLFTRDDPMREVLGSAENSHPEEIAAIRNRLNSEGVKVIRREGTMAYQPSVKPGEPGQIVMEEGASYSAWLHEIQHFDDDKDSGFKGFRLFADPEKAVEMERKAYDVEIEFAKNLGYNDIVKRLEKLKAERIEEILR